mmetsp:Transcript_33384/g.24133  ORF Transcript_33384/g.24133 Transcript_33384/m.24133 type:complete len:221 (+) Transcript_33384:111-773(+)|eukprot:CAMPEP_0116877986 /NCGR_PEP_ID=MMETSP0463-20121206/9745_1 /TAXON_ID=181622 /ORGANISM="Strombidinopsis sp, Strain SopsisLIS2011" /LENGTH=220 /DNA_ID=CAMNT_0004525773 /DNA_START=111 /DNA_END=773 /DNA_ORIENTATION=+
MVETLRKMREKGVHFGIVSGSDLTKVTEQLGKELVNSAEYCFAENGLYAMKAGELFKKQSFSEHLGEERLQKLINFCLKYMANIELPCKRGTFIEYRNGMINVSPIGRNCSKEERNAFEEYDKTANVRKTFVAALEEEFKEDKLKFSIGGQISFDVFPQGWDKSFCLQFIENDYDKIYFFGDKCYDGGNDYEIYLDSRTEGISVKHPGETIEQLTKLFLE